MESRFFGKWSLNVHVFRSNKNYSFENALFFFVHGNFNDEHDNVLYNIHVFEYSSRVYSTRIYWKEAREKKREGRSWKESDAKDRSFRNLISLLPIVTRRSPSTAYLALKGRRVGETLCSVGC